MDSVGAGIGAWVGQMPAGVDPDIEAARQRIGRISRQFERVVTRAAADHGLTAGDVAALSALRRSGPPHVLTPRQLAETLGLTSGTVSVRIDRLTKAGLVEPAESADGRSRPVRLTRKGHRRWSDATRDRTELEQRIFSSALTAEQLAALNPLLATLLGHFENEFGQASAHDTLPTGS